MAGYGDVVIKRGLPGLTALRQDVRCIWGRDRHRAAAAAARHDVPQGTDQASVLLAGVDAVYIATPVSAHVPLVLAAIAAGVHVLVEKPLGGGLGYDQAELLAAERASGVICAVAYYRRLFPAMVAVRKLLGHGPYRVEASFRAPFSAGPADPMHWRTMASSGGGVLPDAGSHRIDLLCWLFGKPGNVDGWVGDPFPGGAERLAVLDLSWPSGSTASLRLQWSGPADRAVDEVTLTGSEHVIWLPQLDSGEVFEDNDRQTRHYLPPEPNVLVPALRDFLRAVDGDGRPSCSLSDGVLVDEVIRATQGRSADPW